MTVVVSDSKYCFVQLIAPYCGAEEMFGSLACLLETGYCHRDVRDAIGWDDREDGGIIYNNRCVKVGLKIVTWGGYSDTWVIVKCSDGDILVCFPEFCRPFGSLTSAIDGLVT